MQGIVRPIPGSEPDTAPVWAAVPVHWLQRCTLRLPCAAPLRASPVALPSGVASAGRMPVPGTHFWLQYVCPHPARACRLHLHSAARRFLGSRVPDRSRPTICLQLYDLSLADFNKHVNWLVQRNHATSTHAFQKVKQSENLLDISSRAWKILEMAPKIRYGSTVEV